MKTLLHLNLSITSTSMLILDLERTHARLIHQASLNRKTPQALGALSYGMIRNLKAHSSFLSQPDANCLCCCPACAQKVDRVARRFSNKTSKRTFKKSATTNKMEPAKNLYGCFWDAPWRISMPSVHFRYSISRNRPTLRTMV